MATEMIRGTRIYLAAIHGWHKQIGAERISQARCLEAYYYLREASDADVRLMMSGREFLLDSGAFTYIGQMSRGKNMKIDWSGYVDDFIAFINKWRVKQFFELDIEAIVGLKRVEEFTERITQETGRKPIPVWHKGRGIKYWKYMVENYDYVAIGGFVGRIPDIKRNEYDHIRKMVNYARQRGVRVHGLGFTS